MEFVIDCLRELTDDSRQKRGQSMGNERMPSTRFAAVGFCFVLFLVLPKPIWCSEPKGSAVISPDSKIQATISRVINAKGDDDKEAREAMNSLKEMARTTPEVVAPQIIYYSLHASNEREGWGIIGMMKHLSTWGSEMRRGLIPLLETKDENIRREVSGWLAGIDHSARPRTEELDVVFYRETLLKQKNAPPLGLVDYVFDHAPSKALLLFGEIYADPPQIPLTWPRDLMWSDHVITTIKWRLRNRFLQEGDLEKAQKELDALSKHEGWYARRYVVEVMRGIPTLGTPEIAKRLKKDAHPLVRDSAKTLAAPLRE
jgi:hypothetical protein